jgi:hypothetical protein
MGRRRSIIRWLTGLALLGGLATGCAPQIVADEDPSVPLARFDGVSVGDFSTGAYLAGVRGMPRYAHIVAVTLGANQTVRSAVLARLRGLKGDDNGPPLLLTAELDDFDARGGHGFMEYHVTLSSVGQSVASYTVRREIMGGVKGAYEAEGDDIARYVMDHQ